MERCDVAVVGGGLAGLACARELVRAGLDVRLWESGDAVGGRVRTDRVDGLLLDRGFQVLNTAYPEARRALDLDALDLQTFDRALNIRVGGRTRRLADPLREPGGLPALLNAPVGGPLDKLALGRYAARVTALPASALKRSADIPAGEAWARQGLDGVPVEQLLTPFLAGVVLEEEITTSRRFVDLMARMFARGRAAVPASGMQAIPDQLAAELPEDAVHLEARVRRVTPHLVESEAGSCAASAVVVATDGSSAAELLGSAVRAPSWKGVTTMYHAAPEPPAHAATLLVDADTSPVNNTIVITAAAPSYATGGRALVATSLVHGPSGAQQATEPEVRGRLAELHDADTSRWEHVGTYDVPQALPAMPAPHRFRKPVRVDRGLYVCGDHRDTSSIQGALVSGRRTAEAVAAELRPGPA